MGFDESNLDRFLRCTTPIVPSRSLPKTQIKNLNPLWYPLESESVEYFRLSDFWDCFDEWSAYGAGVPIVSETDETLVQYYVPYLSAIQIFTSHSVLSALRENTESGDSGSETCSEEWRWEGCSSSEEGFDHQEPLDRLGYSYLQYFERCTPYSRVPLMDKIKELGERHAGLWSLRSVDLSPASWMAVAWSDFFFSVWFSKNKVKVNVFQMVMVLNYIRRYPIYHIPMNRNIKDLSTCFLTYHTLSSSFQDVKKEERKRISVGAFGMATYKMQGRLWDNDRLLCLKSVADSWLKQLRVHHHDFTYFTTTPHY